MLLLYPWAEVISGACGKWCCLTQVSELIPAATAEGLSPHTTLLTLTMSNLCSENQIFSPCLISICHPLPILNNHLATLFHHSYLLPFVIPPKSLL